MTDRSTEIAATLAKLAALLAEEEPAPPVEERTVRSLPSRVLLTVEEAAQQLGIGRTTAYALVRSGELESVHIGRLRRIPKEAIDQYAARLIQERPSQQQAA
ncbi:helix-turn-helix domain-containing protein [Saccharopolyspora sp. HNM0986]|uniref:helix-turn-helix domain-containing protein n=1 Tax=Saccharopolyspora galaxeae TaxID=2781241 RepID=UPI00190B81A3|nr:helix-turn-helix domain-containing protein [Saccharopolyspora sp. HNM0986]MBK0866147.1 helix-turn-helix domain-containing protein [Saccharopolyspora sp. HNM0986]